MRILYAEDDSDDKEFVMQAFANIDDQIECIAVENGKDAIDRLRNGRDLPNLIMLDLNMPIMNGRQCLLELKKDSTLRHIPVVMYSTSTNPQEIHELLTLGARNFLSKPTSFDTLCQLLKELVEKFEPNGRVRIR